MDDERRGDLTRRTLLGAVALGGVLGGALAGCSRAAPSAPDVAPVPGPLPAVPTGQRGVAEPENPPTHLQLHVLTAADDPAGVHARLVELVASAPPGATVTVGLGPRLVAARRPDLPGAQELPLFAGDDALAPELRRGDLAVLVAAPDPGQVDALSAAVLAVPGATPAWGQRAYRRGERGASSVNPVGFRDGIVQPRGSAGLAASVWREGPGPLAGSTILVVRRLRMDVARFGALTPEQQAAAVGRAATGEPLSGGGPDDEVALQAKTPAGRYLVPLDAHVRRAHPSVTGSPLMLRRSYSYGSADDTGVLFLSFQRELRTFVATQVRLDESDALLRHATPTASGTFLVLAPDVTLRDLAS